MTPVRPAAGSNQGNRDSREQLLLDFEQAWQRETPPTLEEFLPAGGSERRELLEELIKIDLEWRWRRKPVSGNAPVRPRLEDYAARYPELGRLSLALIGEEYRVRQRWGDRPAHEEYLQRFPQHKADLRKALARQDALAKNEFSGPRAPRTEAPSGPASLPSQGPAPRAIASSAALLDVIREHQLLLPAQLGELSSRARKGAAHDLAKELLQRGWLTPYQVNQLLQGRGPELVLGPYVLLERLGEGGIGQVYKARHQKMNRIVALKLLRKELLTDPDVMGRFGREIQVIGQLDHPNIVHAYDAGPLTPNPHPRGERGRGEGAAHVLAMEYVEGINLARLVSQQGPVSPHQACDWIRQAALGLQYAHERGLVHRDLKPSNLIVTQVPGSASLVKILDLGLARLRGVGAGAATMQAGASDMPNTLTPPDAVMLMGTPDYMAPEQAFDFHGADVRADIYSLGCTLFYLLTGQPPFPGGTLAEKLTRHQRAEPPSIQQLRPELPSVLNSVLQKMLAKEPANRYQTPAAVAEALNLLLVKLGPPAAVPLTTQPTARQAVPVATLINRPTWKTRLAKLAPGWLRHQASKRRRRLKQVGAVVLAGIVIYLLVLLTRSGPVGWLVLEPVQFTSEGGATLTKLPDRSILASGKIAPADTYTVTAYTDLQGITAIRLELLTDPSLPAQGPGRHLQSGNPVLSEIRLLAAPRKDPSKTEPVVLLNPTADMNQDSWGVTGAVDGRTETGWAIAPKMGERHWAVFETKKPVGFSGGTLLIFVLDQKYPEGPIGRFRLSVTRAPPPVRALDKLPDLER